MALVKRRVWVALALALLLSGCVSPGPIDTVTVTSWTTVTRTVQPQSHRPLHLMDNMDLQFDGANGSMPIRIRSQRIMDGFGQWSDGHVVSIKTLDGWEFHFGMGPCMTPVWVEQNQQDVHFALSGDSDYFEFLPGWLFLPNATLGHLEEFWHLRTMKQFPLNGADHRMAAATNGDVTLTSWTWKSSVPVDPEREYQKKSVWYHQAVPSGTVPEWFNGFNGVSKQGDLRLNHTTIVAWGNPIIQCPNFAPVPSTIPKTRLTARATADDPPLAWSLHDMIAFAESNKDLKMLQSWRSDPNVIIYEWWGRPVNDYTLFKWTITYGNPSTHKLLEVYCDQNYDAQLPKISPITVTCSESLGDQDELRPLPPLDLANETIESYSYAFNLYKELYGTEACSMRMSYNAVFRGPNQSGWLIPALVLRCDLDQPPVLLIDPSNGAIQRLGNPMPAIFAQPGFA